MFEFPSFNRSVDLRCFPLSYQNVNFGQIQPDEDALCDLPICRSPSTTDIKRLACFHTFHKNCISPSGACPICQLPLEKKVEELSQTFNKGLLDNQTETSDESSDDDEDNTDVDDQLLTSSPTNCGTYYRSQEWQTKLTEITNTYQPVKQPNEPNRIQHLLQPARRPPLTTQTTPSTATDNNSRPPIQKSQFPSLNLNIPATAHQNFTTWHFPQRLSQSTIEGQNGSNGCTLIALTITKLFYSFPPASINPNLPLDQTLAYQTVSGILIGNQNYDRVTMGVPRLFGVREAVSHLSFLGNISVGSELPVSASNEPVPSATLAFHLELASQKAKTACFFILNGNTVVFIPVTPNYVLLIDSHLHGQTGAFVALCEMVYIRELLRWYKSYNNFQYSLGTVTQVTFL